MSTWLASFLVDSHDFSLVRAGLVVAIMIPPSLYQRHWRFIYGATIGVMLFVFVFAAAVRGSKRWIDLGPFQFQPSEFGKLLFVLALAGFIAERSRRLTPPGPRGHELRIAVPEFRSPTTAR